ncbi:MAG TPA: hypothetical protein VF699_11495 [Caulobacteraceae bacterium]
MKRPVLTTAAVASSLLAGSALAQTTRDYAAIYGARSGASAQLSPQQDVTTTVGTGPATRYAKPQPGSERAVQPRGTGRDFGYQDYGTVSGGYPAYGSREFPTPPPAAVQAQQEEASAEEAPAEEGQAQEQGQQAEGQEEFAVSEGFFFDNYTSGTGFGVYGGEAVSSGSGSPLILPSAGNRAQELGFPTGPNNGGARTPPTEPEPDPEG